MKKENEEGKGMKNKRRGRIRREKSRKMGRK